MEVEAEAEAVEAAVKLTASTSLVTATRHYWLKETRTLEIVM